MHELSLNDVAAVENLIDLCTKGIPNQETRSKAIDLIYRAKKNQKIVVPLDTLDLDENKEAIPLAKLLAKLAVEDGEVSQIEEISEASNRSVGRGVAKALGTCAVRQETPRIIVSAVQISTKCTATNSHRNFHIQGTLRMKSSAIL